MVVAERREEYDHLVGDWVLGRDLVPGLVLAGGCLLVLVMSCSGWRRAPNLHSLLSVDLALAFE